MVFPCEPGIQVMGRKVNWKDVTLAIAGWIGVAFTGYVCAVMEKIDDDTEEFQTDFAI